MCNRENETDPPPFNGCIRPESCKNFMVQFKPNFGINCLRETAASRGAIRATPENRIPYRETAIRSLASEEAGELEPPKISESPNAKTKDTRRKMANIHPKYGTFPDILF